MTTYLQSLFKKGTGVISSIVLGLSLIVCGASTAQVVQVVETEFLTEAKAGNQQLLYFAPPGVDEKNREALNTIISLDLNDVPMEEALRYIADQGNLRISYSIDVTLVNRSQSVNLELKEATVLGALYKVLEGTDLRLTINSKGLLIVHKGDKPVENGDFLQDGEQDTVSGTVIDSQSGETLPGVNILVKGTTTGGTTDIDGHFEFTAPSLNDTLIFSYVGYQTIEEPLNGRAEINIELEPLSITGEDVVVVGYGVQQELTVTGSVSSVNQEEITSIPTGDIASRLQGRVAGARITQNHGPSGGSVVRIRGIGTIGNNDPLYVVDGVPVNDISGLNPNSIESISILKDAASSAIYGSRAANGVVVITTERGEFDTPLQVNFNARYGVQQVTSQLDLLNVQELGEKKWQELKNDGVGVGDSGWGDLQYGFGPEPVIPDYVFPARASEGDTGTNESLYNFGDPYYGITRANKEGTDWLDEIFHITPVQEYSLQISGGSDITRFSITGSYYNNEGILIHSGYERYNLGTNLDFDISDWLMVGTSLGATLGESQGTSGSGAINAALRIHPMLPVYDIMGNFAGTKSPGTGNQNNPVSIQYRNRDDRNRQLRLLTNTYAQLNIMDELSFRSTLGVDLNSNHSRNYDRANPEFTQTNFGNSYSEGESGRFRYNWSNTLTYENTFQDAHSLNILLGSELVSNYDNSFNASRDNYAFEDVDYMVLDAGEDNLNNSGSYNEWALFSYFSRINYNYREKYLVEAVLRRDASSRFTGDYRWGTFPAVSLGWRILEDLGSVSFIDDLKLRVSWGQNGNDNVGNYNQYSTYVANINTSYYAIDGSDNSVTSGFRAASIGNPDGRWETSTTTNLGVDIYLLDYSLQANIDVYTRKTTDMLYPDTQPATLGNASRPDVNIGEMKNTGIDIMLTYNGTAGSDFFYTVSGNFTHYKNEVISLNDDPDEFQYGFDFEGTPSTITQGGLPVSSFYGYIVEGIFNTQEEVDAHVPYNPNESGVDSYSAPGMFKYRDVNGDGIIDSNDRTIIGNPHPDFVYGLNFDLRYKTWDLSLFFEGSYGNDIYNHVRRELLFNRYDGNFLKERLHESWTADRYEAGEKITVPITTNEDAILQSPSTFLVEDGSYFKLKNLQAGYTLPAGLSSRFGIQNLRVFFQATNVFTVTNYSGLDPELNTGNDLSIGVDTSVYPTARILSMGVNFNL